MPVLLVRYNFQVGVQHPNIWVFIRSVKDEQRHCQRQLGAAEHGAAPPSRKRCYLTLQQRIERLKVD